MSHEAAPNSCDPEATAALPGSSAPLASAWTTCWRCAKQVAADVGACPFCEARLSATTPPSARVGAQAEGTAITFVCWAFALLLLGSLVQAAVLALSPDVADPRAASTFRLYVMLGTEALDTLIIVVALAWCFRQVRPSLVSTRSALGAWCMAPFVLAALLVLNFSYHALLRGIIHAPLSPADLLFEPRDTTLVLLAICVQPALVEEMFFRYLAVGVFRAAMSVHAAVWVSSAMFGMAHVGTPLSIPMLFVLGLGLGYMRVLSGGLALPMLMHFAHNAAVLVVERQLA